MLKFISNSSAFNGHNSAFFRHKNYMLLFDCGGLIADKLIDEKILYSDDISCETKEIKTNYLDGIKHLDVAITHFHSDHVGSLGELIFYAYYYLGVVTNVIYPNKEKMINKLREEGVNDSFYNVMEVPVGSATVRVMEDRDIKLAIESHSVEHRELIDAYAYTVKVGAMDSDDKCKMYYSGDAKKIPEDILLDFYVNEIDYIYQDVTIAEYMGYPHMSLSALEKVIPSHSRNRVYLMHLEKNFDYDKAKELGFRISQVVEDDYLCTAKNLDFDALR